MSSPRNRLFLFLVFALSLLWSVALLLFYYADRRRFSRLFHDLEFRYAQQFSNYVVHVSVPSSSPVSASVSVDAPARQRPSYRVEGSGQNRKYFYLDVRHCNGERARYYAPFSGGPSAFLAMVDRLSMDEQDVLSGWDLFPSHVVSNQDKDSSKRDSGIAFSQETN